MSHDEPHIPIRGEPLGMSEFDEKTTEYDLVDVTEEAMLHCAQVVHAAIEGLNEEFFIPTIPWEMSRDSLLAGVRRVLANPGETPEENHEAWMAHRRGEGWTHGPVKDVVQRVHPSLVPYAVLPVTERAKNAIFLGVVRRYFGVG